MTVEVNKEAEKTQRGYARLAGFLFLGLIIVDFASGFILSRVAGSGTLAERAARIVASEHLYRGGLSRDGAGELRQRPACFLPVRNAEACPSFAGSTGDDLRSGGCIPRLNRAYVRIRDGASLRLSTGSRNDRCRDFVRPDEPGCR